MDIPADAVILNELRIIEYMDADGCIHKLNLSNSRDDDMSVEKHLELAEWARIFATAPVLAEIIQEYLSDDGGQD